MLADSGEAIVWIADPAMNINYVNQPLLRFTGRTLPEEMGPGVFNRLHPEERPVLLAQFERSVPLRERISASFRLRRWDAEYRWFQGVAIPRFDRQGEFLGYLGTALDVTALKEASEARLMLERQVLHDQRIDSLGVLAGGIAHDFNNILMAVLGNVEVLKFRLPPDSPLRDAAQGILSAGQRAKALVGRILQFSRTVDTYQEQVAVAPILEETLVLLKAAIPSSIAFHLENACLEAVLRMDATELTQIIMNLCMNAAHAIRGTGTGVPSLGIHPSRQEGRDWIEITVADTGSGIPPDILNRIFDPFFTTKGVHEGTGLGLSMVHGIVSRAGGSIEVDSRPGQGTAFRIRLPKAAGPGQAPGAEVTGHSGDLEAAALAEAGVTLLLDKPIAPSALLRRLEGVLPPAAQAPAGT